LCSKIIKLQNIDSTHEFAIRLIENNQAMECAIIAENQTNGIGRCERSWISSRGNLFTSIIRNFSRKEDLGQLSLTVACAVHDVIADYIKKDLYLHWPNDVHYKKSKIAGILITVINDWIIISIGMNVNSAPDIVGAVSLVDICKFQSISVEQILESILIKLKKWLDNLHNLGFLHIKHYWLRYINEINRKIIIRNGSDSLAGIFRGIDDSGKLILELNGRNLLISSGDMFLNTKGITVNHE
jgi:BirA family biotin operon repressor/biotin-[acetyl-CoA-carboxylase] ligase